MPGFVCVPNWDWSLLSRALCGDKPRLDHGCVSPPKAHSKHTTDCLRVRYRSRSSLFPSSRFARHIPKGACSPLPVDAPCRAEKAAHHCVSVQAVKLLPLVPKEHLAACGSKEIPEGETVLLRNLELCVLGLVFTGEMLKGILAW